MIATHPELATPTLVIVATPEHAKRLVEALESAVAGNTARVDRVNELLTLKRMASTFRRDYGHEPRLVEIRVSPAAPPKGGAFFRKGVEGTAKLVTLSAPMKTFALKVRR